MKDTPHDHFAADDLTEQDVPVKGTQDDEKPPRREPRMRERRGGADDGMAPLNGRTREDVLHNDTKDYQRFRRTWAELRSVIGALIPKHGDAYSGSPFKPKK